MNLPCKVIEDLLPLYHDGVCSEESKTLVDRHLRDCAACKDVLHSLNEELTLQKEVDAAKPLVAIKDAWKKARKSAWLRGFGVAFLIVAILFGGFCGLTQWEFIKISTHLMEVAEIYQLEDGRILYKLDVPDSVFCRSFTFETRDDGSLYKTPVRAMIDLSAAQGFDSLLDDYMMLDPGENNAYAKATGGTMITKWYFGWPGNAILIYEEGMELEPAPAELEAKYGTNR